MTDKKQILDNLMEHGKTTGKLTTKEITDALENINIMQEDLQPKKRYLKQYLQN